MKADNIVLALSLLDPRTGRLGDMCFFCDGENKYGVVNSVPLTYIEHTDVCLWLRAKNYVDTETES